MTYTTELLLDDDLQYARATSPNVSVVHSTRPKPYKGFRLCTRGSLASGGGSTVCGKSLQIAAVWLNNIWFWRMVAWVASAGNVVPKSAWGEQASIASTPPHTDMMHPSEERGRFAPAFKLQDCSQVQFWSTLTLPQPFRIRLLVHSAHSLDLQQAVQLENARLCGDASAPDMSSCCSALCRDHREC